MDYNNIGGYRVGELKVLIATEQRDLTRRSKELLSEIKSLQRELDSVMARLEELDRAESLLT